MSIHFNKMSTKVLIFVELFETKVVDPHLLPPKVDCVARAQRQGYLKNKELR